MNQIPETGKKTRVLHICETAKGGIGTYLELVCSSTSDLVDNFIIAPSGHLPSEQLQLKSLTFKNNRHRLRRLVSLVISVRKYLKNNDVDIVFIHSTLALSTLATVRLFSRPYAIIYCSHGWAALRYSEGTLKRQIVTEFEKRLSSWPDIVLNISGSEKRHAETFKYKGRHVLLENAVLERPTQKTHDKVFNGDGSKINIIFVGRLDRQKGIDLLVEAFLEASVCRDDLHLHIVGEPVLGDCDINMAELSHINISFYGWLTQDEVAEMFLRADVTIVPSRWEGFGLVVIESYRAGTPVVVSDKGALPDLVDSEETGYVFSLSVECLTLALRSLSKSGLHSMRDACRRRFEERYSEKRFRMDLMEVYSEVKSWRLN